MSLVNYSDISDYQVYNDRMNRSIMDKLFFVSHVNDPNSIVDFGCANGILIDHLSNWFPDTDLWGYDEDEEMISKCTDKYKEDENKTFTDNWDKIALQKKQPSVLVLSSIIHEVYHYSDVKEIENFWSRVWNSDFDYIVLRDMIPSKTIDRKPPKERIRKVYSEFGGTKELSDFENEWGSIESSNKQLIHFLLKYRYTTPNWEREVREHYFPFYKEDLYREIPGKYSILFHHHYVLPYIKQKVRNDFDIELEDPTHFKLILENK